MYINQFIYISPIYNYEKFLSNFLSYNIGTSKFNALRHFKILMNLRNVYMIKNSIKTTL